MTIEVVLDNRRDDSFLTLYKPDGTTVIEFDNNDGAESGSRIEFVPATSELYYVKVGAAQP